MENIEKRWEKLMGDAQTAYVNAHFEHSLELNNSALALSKNNFSELFQKNAEKAVATVLVSYFSAIDNCETLAEYPKAQRLFNSALHFLHAEKVRDGLSIHQQTAILRGASQIYKEWCSFVNVHRTDISESEQNEFQSSINRLSSLRNSAALLN